MVTALGIRPDGKNQGVSPQVHRHIISSQWTSDGIIYGLNVTGGTGLSYTVSRSEERRVGKECHA